ncbi:hypothetical protein ACFWY9_01780 [Amycolatopsis sp. NPDC059027]|uniref:hypothetical protein n=1 Tax=Amycolatopsis sp. NPDC059027 TaxID=3346709 RepID=UPI00366C4DCD
MHLLLIGDGALADAVAGYTTAWGAGLRRLSTPSVADLHGELGLDSPNDTVDVVVIVSRDDIWVLRHALLVEHVRPGIRLLVTLFDKTVAEELVRSVPDCTVIGMTDALVPALLGPCIDEELTSLCVTSAGDYVGVRRVPGGLRAMRPAPGEIVENVPSGPGCTRSSGHWKEATARYWPDSPGCCPFWSWTRCWVFSRCTSR